MKERKIVFSARSVVILLSLVLCVSVVCGVVAAEKWVYVPTHPTWDEGDPGSENVSSLVTALEGDGDIIVLTNKEDPISLGRSVRINGTKTLVSYYPEGMVVNAGGTITIPPGSSLTLGTGVNELTLNGAHIEVSGTRDKLSRLVMNGRVNIVTRSASEGIISVENGEFSMNGGNISGNTGEDNIVGGVHVNDGGKFTQNGGNITKNQGRIGGVLIENGGKYELHSGTVAENTASIKGGGVHVNGGGEFTQSGGNIVNNTASAGDGGGVYLAVSSNGGGKFTQSGGNIANNTATNGGGVYLAAASSGGGMFTQNGGNISFNRAVNGSGVYLAASETNHATYRMTSGSLNDNTAGQNGGGVYLSTHFSSSTFSFDGGEIVNNRAEAGAGGAVYLAPFPRPFYNQSFGVNYAEGAVLSMSGGTIADNSAPTSGGVYVSGEQKKMPEGRYKFVQTIFDMSGGTIRNNSNTAVYVSAGKFSMSGGQITQHSDTSSYPVYVNDSPDNPYPALGVKHQGIFEMSGGYIYDNPGSRPYVYNNNSSVTLSGGAVYYTGETDTSSGVENLGTLEISGGAVISGFNKSGVLNRNAMNMSGGTIMENAGEYGGGIHNTGNLSLTGGWIWNNTARKDGGGISSTSPITISGTVLISENNATNNGGGVNTTVLTMSGGEISANTANVSGGGVYAESVTMSGGEISRNTAASGGAVVFTKEFTMTDGSLRSNSAVSGGALYMANLTNTTFSMYGGTIWGNSAANGSGMYFTDGDFILGDSGYISPDNDVVVGADQRINVTKNLTSSAGVYSIVPVTDKPQTVVVVSVEGKNATSFIPNFNLNSSYSGSAYYNNLTPTESTIVIGHKAAPRTSGGSGSGGSGGGGGVSTLQNQAVYSVTFDPNNGADVPEVYDVYNGSLVPKPEDPVYGDAEFIGWFTLYGYEWDFENNTVDSPLVLYANWKGDPYPVRPIVTPQLGETQSPIPIPFILIGAGVLVAVAAAVLLIRKRNS